MADGTVWTCPHNRGDVDNFVMRATRAFGGPEKIRSIEEVDYKFAFMLNKEGQRSGLAGDSAEGVIDIITFAAQENTAAGTLPTTPTGDGQITWESILTQDPALGNQSRLVPRAMMVMVSGISVVVQIGALQSPAVEADDDAGPPPVAEPSETAMDLIAGIQSTFDSAVFSAYQGSDRRFSIPGHSCVSYGSSRVALYTPDTVAETPRLLYSGQGISKDRGWRKLGQPFVLGADSQLALMMHHARNVAWPILDDTRLRVEVTLPMIIVRSNGNEAPDAAKWCGPLKAAPPGYVAGGPGTPFG